MECCQNSGGRVALTFNTPAGPRKYAVRASVTVRPTTVETAAEANQDGSMYVTTKAVPAEAEITLSDKCGLRLEDILGCSVDATIDLIDMRRTYLFTRSRVVGRPEISTENGEISGLKIASSQVKEIQA